MYDVKSRNRLEETSFPFRWTMNGAVSSSSVGGQTSSGQQKMTSASWSVEGSTVCRTERVFSRSGVEMSSPCRKCIVYFVQVAQMFFKCRLILIIILAILRFDTCEAMYHNTITYEGPYVINPPPQGCLCIRDTIDCPRYRCMNRIHIIHT